MIKKARKKVYIKINRIKRDKRKSKMIKYIRLARKYKDFEWFNDWRTIMNIKCFKLHSVKNK